MARVERYGPGESMTTPTCPGDFILTHRHELYSRVVSFGQRIHFRGADRPFAHWSHAALVTGFEGQIIEAVSKGVARNTLEEYRDVEYHYVRTIMAMDDRVQATRFAASCVGQKYAWVTIGSLGLVILVNTPFEIVRESTMFCSELVARSLERGPYIFEKSPSMMMPAHLAKHFNVLPQKAQNGARPKPRAVLINP